MNDFLSARGVTTGKNLISLDSHQQKAPGPLTLLRSASGRTRRMVWHKPRGVLGTFTFLTVVYDVPLAVVTYPFR